MSERKIVLYLEQKAFFEKKQYAYNRDHDPLNRPRIADFYFFNSLSRDLDTIFKNLNISEETLLDLRKKSIKRIVLLKWTAIQRHLNKVKIEDVRVDGDFITHTLRSFLKDEIPLILKIDDKFLVEERIARIKPYLGDTVSFIHDDVLISSKKFRNNPTKYRLYLNDRLLIERYYPVDIESNRMIAETIYLKDNAQGTLRIESDFDLQIKRVEVDEQKQDIYSFSFALPNPDK